jgi:hypothetical protein
MSYDARHRTDWALPPERKLAWDFTADFSGVGHIAFKVFFSRYYK